MQFKTNFKSGLKTTKTKKLKKPTEQQLVEKLRKKCVAKAKEIAKQNDDYKCIYCGIGKPQRQVHSHHFFHEGLHKAMSADIDNLITLCVSHHQGVFNSSIGRFMGSHDNFNFHNSPVESTLWFAEHYPERYKELKERSLKIVHLDRLYWENKWKELSTVPTV